MERCLGGEVNIYLDFLSEEERIEREIILDGSLSFGLRFGGDTRESDIWFGETCLRRNDSCKFP